MPVFNAEQTLESAMQSVLSQTHTNLELIIVDDASTDQSARLAKENIDSRVRVLCLKKNSGTAAAQNLGFSQARGSLLALHDADDLWKSTKLERHVAELDQNPNIDVSYSYSQMISRSGVLLRNRQTPKTFQVSLEDILLHHPVGNGSNAVFRYSLIKKILEHYPRVVNETLASCHDIEMWVRIMITTHCIFAGIPEILNYYRISDSSYSGNLVAKERFYEDMLRTIAQYAPELISKQGNAARAFHYRYLARRAFIQGQPKLGLHYILRGIRFAPFRLFRYEGAKTITTFCANLLSMGIPTSLRRRFIQVSTTDSPQRKSLDLI